MTAVIVPDDDLLIGKELERKYVDALLNRLAEHERGEITTETLKACFESIFAIVSGLVDWADLNAVVADYSAYIEEEENDLNALI